MKKLIIEVEVEMPDDCLYEIHCIKEEYVDEFKQTAESLIRWGQFDYYEEEETE